MHYEVSRKLSFNCIMSEATLTSHSNSSDAKAECPPAKSGGKGAAFWLAFGAMLVALFLHALDMCAIPTALPTIIDDLHGGDKFIWVGSAYALASTAILFPCSRFADVFGRKVVLLVSITSFAVGSALAGAAQNMNMLIAARGSFVYPAFSSRYLLNGRRSPSRSRGWCHILHVQHHHVRPCVISGARYLSRLPCFDVLSGVRHWARSRKCVDEVNHGCMLISGSRAEVCPLVRPGDGYSVRAVPSTNVRRVLTALSSR